MTITPVYANVDEFRRFVKDPSTLDEEIIVDALESASREVDSYCGRHFYNHTDPQYFSPSGLWTVDFDDMDLSTTTGLIVQSEAGNLGTYLDTWTLDVDYIATPQNTSVAGIENWPYTGLRAVGGKSFPPRAAPWTRDTIKVSGAPWGWLELPAPVKLSTLMLAAENFKAPDAPWGVAGFGAFGQVRVRDNPKIAVKLRPYKKHTTLMMA